MHKQNVRLRLTRFTRTMERCGISCRRHDWLSDPYSLLQVSLQIGLALLASCIALELAALLLQPAASASVSSLVDRQAHFTVHTMSFLDFCSILPQSHLFSLLLFSVPLSTLVAKIHFFHCFFLLFFWVKEERNKNKVWSCPRLIYTNTHCKWLIVVGKDQHEEKVNYLSM